MEFSEMRTRALTTRRHHESFETAKFGRSWTTEEVALGFVGDVGDLTKRVLAHEGVWDIAAPQAKLADTCEVKLEGAFSKTMDDLEGVLA